MKAERPLFKYIAKHTNRLLSDKLTLYYGKLDAWIKYSTFAATPLSSHQSNPLPIQNVIVVILSIHQRSIARR